MKLFTCIVYTYVYVYICIAYAMLNNTQIPALISARISMSSAYTNVVIKIVLYTLQTFATQTHTHIYMYVSNINTILIPKMVLLIEALVALVTNLFT